MSKTNSTPTPANQSASASNDVSASAASSKAPHTSNYAAVAARSATSNRPLSGTQNPSSAAATPSFASAAGSVPPPPPAAPSAPPSNPSSIVKPPLVDGSATPPLPRPTVPSTLVHTNPAAARISPVVPDSRRTSLAGIKSHNVKPSATNAIAFGSLADTPAQTDVAATLLASSPANPPRISQRDGPPVFGSVPTDLNSKAEKTPPAATPPTTPVAPASTKPTTAPADQSQPPVKTGEKKKYDFQSYFVVAGETAPQQSSITSNGSSPSPSMSLRQDPTQNRRTNTFDVSNQPHPHPSSPRSTHLGVPNAAVSNSSHSPLSAGSRTFTPGQGQLPTSHSQPQALPHHYAPNPAHWPTAGAGQQAPNPHFAPGGGGLPPHNNMANYPLPNGVGPNNSNQFHHKPSSFSTHRNVPGPGGPQSNAHHFAPNGRPNMHHPRANPAAGPAPPSPRLPSAPGAAPGSAPPPSGSYNPSGPNVPAYWPQGPYPVPNNGPGASAAYPPYAYSPSNMPAYAHPSNFAPPPQPPQSHPSPQMTHPPVLLSHRAPPLSTSPASHGLPPSSASGPGVGHARGASLSYTAASFSPSIRSPEVKPRGAIITASNAAAAPFLPRKSAAVPIKRPAVAPVSATLEESSEAVVEDSRKEPKKDVEAEVAKKKAEEEAKVKAEKEKEESEKIEAEKKRLAEELAVAEKKRAAEEEKEKERLAEVAAAEAEAKRQAEEKERLEREAEETIKKETAEKEAQEKAEALEKQKEKASKIDTEDKAAQKLKTESTKTNTIDEPSSLPSKPVNGSGPILNNKVRPTPIDVNAVPISKSSMSPALPSALLSSARKIEDLGQVSYPDNIQSPRPDLNAEAAPGKFRYDRAFLLQFMEVCKGKPAQLPDLDSIGLVDASSGMMGSMSRTQSGAGQRRNAGQLPLSGGRGPLTPSGPGSMAGFVSAGGMPGRAGSSGMPMFAAGSNRTSEDRFSQSNRLGAMPIGSGLLPGRPTGQMSRSPSANALPGIMSTGARDTSRRSGRGSRRDGGPSIASTGPASGLVRGGMGGGMQQPIYSMTGEIVQPLQSSANSWATARSNTLDEDSPEMVNRKVRALLNKLTLDKFDSISDQVIVWANKSEKESDGRILRQVIALIFEKATDEAHWSEMYAKLCRKLMEKLSNQVQDEGVKDANGVKVNGGNLFRKYLLNRCQEDYERGWSRRDELAAAAAGKAADDAVKQAANERSRAEAEASGKEGIPKEAEILSDEYYAAQKAKRQGLGLVRFIGELFKLNMLTERIMHECIKKLLSNVDTPEEEDIESLCRLMMTVGKMLDHEKANSHINVYFSRMTTMAENKNLSSRARFMIQDVIDARKNRWIGRNVAAGPKLTSQIREEAAAQAAAEQSRQAQAKVNMSKGNNNDLSRGGSRGGRNRGDQFGGNGGVGPDGWSLPVSAAPAPRPSKAGDLTGFGTVRHTSSSGRPTFGPSMAFANKGKMKDAKGGLNGDLGGAAVVASNPFAALNADVGDSTGGSTLTSKPSVAEVSAPGSGRPRLNLAPRTLPLPGGKAEKEPEATETEPAAEEENDVDDATAERLVKTRIDEFFNVKSVEEGVASFEGLPTARHFMLIRALIEKCMDMKISDVSLTAELFRKLSVESVVHKEVFGKAFEPVIEMLDDTVVDAPCAYEHCGKLLFSAGFEAEEVKLMGTKIDTDDPALAEEKLVDAFALAWGERKSG